MIEISPVSPITTHTNFADSFCLDVGAVVLAPAITKIYEQSLGSAYSKFIKCLPFPPSIATSVKILSCPMPFLLNFKYTLLLRKSRPHCVIPLTTCSGINGFARPSSILISPPPITYKTGQEYGLNMCMRCPHKGYHNARAFRAINFLLASFQPDDFYEQSTSVSTLS